MKVQKNIEVRLVEKRLPRPIDLVQYDTGIQLVFSLLDFNIPENTAATLYVQKPSGMFVFQETGIVVEADTITIDLENQALTEHGNNIPYQVRLQNGSDLLTTFAGIMRVEKSLANDGAVKSKTVIAAFEAKTAEQIAEIEAAAAGFVSDAKDEIERKGAETLATIPEDYTELQSDVKHLFDNAANGIKGNVSGAVVAVDDVSPVEHAAKVKVSGKNLFDVSKVISDSQNQIINNGDGTLTVNTSSTSSAVPINSMKLRDLAPFLEIGKEYVLSADSTGTTKQIWLDIANKKWLFGESAVVTEEMLGSSVFMYASGNSTTALVSHIQIEKGDTATEYTPYIDPPTVTVTRCGKNQIHSEKIENKQWKNAPKYTANGVSWKTSDTREIVVQGTTPDEYYSVFDIATGDLFTEWLVDGQTYTASLNKTGNGDIELIADVIDKETGVIKQYIRNGTVFTVDKSRYNYGTFRLQIQPNKTVSAIVRPQIEFGDVMTSFEPYTEKTYTPAADGTVSGLTSVSPNMTILTDTDGVTVECEYIKDTNKVIAKLVDAISDLGGSVSI